MAILWPRQMPHEVRANVLRSAECKVYDRLSEVLDDEFHVFYSRPWLGLRPDGSEIDGECDFVVAHPKRGLLMIEVKGGAVSYNPATEQWTSRDRWNYLHVIKNPVGQARSAKHTIYQRLQESRKWRPRRIVARHGVILPDADAPQRDLGMDMPRRLFCCREEFETGLREWVLARLGEVEDGGRTESPGAEGIAALEDILARPFQLRMPSRHVAEEDDRALQMLTTQQYHILAELEDVPRVAIAGGAGTGKTVLATEKAVRCAEAGRRTLLTCYNAPLAADLAGRVSGCARLDVRSFHALCSEMAEAAGFPVPRDGDKRQLFDNTLPELLMKAAEMLPDRRYDVIVVDEGQDFRLHWWLALEAMLAQGGDGHLYVFFDNNQQVYQDLRSLPKDLALVPIRLSRNLRNTRHIHEVASAHYEGPAIEAIGPEGSQVEWSSVSEAKIGDAMERTLKRLVGQEEFAPDDIAVLCANDRELGIFCRGGRIGSYVSTACDRPESGRLVADTVRRFKGLERRVVIVVATDAMTDDQELRYLALSRPRTHLIVIGTQRNLDRMRGTARD
jgi:hypothetical protein